MSINLHKKILENAIKKAIEEMPFHEVRDVCIKTLNDFERMVVNIREAQAWTSISDEEDAKQIDDAQRYRDLKSER
jgi:hypothetical protein